MPKQIELKTGKEKFNGQDITVTTKDLITMALNVPPPQTGFTFEEIKKRFRVSDALDKCEVMILTLEDADYETLKKCANSAGWTMRTRFLFDFLEQFNS